MADVQDQFARAFPDQYRERKGYHSVDFGQGAKIYLLKSKAHILVNSIGNLPNGSELKSYLDREGIYIKDTGQGSQFEIPAEHVDRVVAILRRGSGD